jgi:hypothetical protein
MSYRHGGNSASLTSTVTWTLTGIAISAYCAALVSSTSSRKDPGGHSWFYFPSAAPRKDSKSLVIACESSNSLDNNSSTLPKSTDR